MQHNQQQMCEMIEFNKSNNSTVQCTQYTHIPNQNSCMKNVARTDNEIGEAMPWL